MIPVAFISHVKSPVAFGNEKWRLSIYIDPINVIKSLGTYADLFVLECIHMFINYIFLFFECTVNYSMTVQLRTHSHYGCPHTGSLILLLELYIEYFQCKPVYSSDPMHVI